MNARGLGPALLLSGAASLLQEVAWNRSWVLVFGAGTEVTAVILAIFMVGMALGGRYYRVLGRLLRARGVALYRRAEIALAVLALAAPMLLAAADHAFLLAARAWGPTHPGLVGVRMLLATFALAPPALLMGATLPALASDLRGSPEALERRMARLYSWNTLGATLGVTLGGYLAIPGLGIRKTLWVAAAASLLAAWWTRNLGAREPPEDAAEAPPELSRPVGPVLAAYAFVGFWALALEVLLARVVLATSGATSFAFSSVLASFLMGMAAGSWWGGRAGSGDDPREALGRRLLELGAVTVATGYLVPLSPWIYIHLYPLVEGLLGAELGTWGLSLLLLLPIGLALGRIFPVAARGLLPPGASPGAAGEAVGRAFFVNSLAGAAGALAAHYLIAPLTGLRGGVVAAGIACLLASLAYLYPSGARRPMVVAGTLILGLLMSPMPRFQLLRPGYRYGELPLEQRPLAERWLRPPEVLWYRDGPDVSVAITQIPGSSSRVLRINGKSDASLEDDMNTQVAIGALPAFFTGDDAEALLVGLGSGATAETLLQLPLRRLDVAELSPTVLEGARAGFGAAFPQAFRDPRTTTHVLDGRHLIRAWPRRVDLIVNQPTNIFIAGVANLFTEEFFRACRLRLRPGGLLVQWMQDYHLTEEALAQVVRTMAREFPHLLLTWHEDFVILASDEPIQFDLERARPRLTAPRMAALLRQASLEEAPLELARKVVARRAALLEWAGPGTTITDDLPTLEFHTARHRFQRHGARLVETVLEIRRQPSFDPALPLRGLGEPVEGGTLFPAARLFVAAELAGEFHLVRSFPARAPAKAVMKGTDGILFGRWTRAGPTGKGAAVAYPSAAVPDLRSLLASLLLEGRGRAPSTAEDPGHPGRGTAFGHPVTVHTLPAAEGQPPVASAVWRCPRGQVTYGLRWSPARGDPLPGLGELARGVSCLHETDDARWSWSQVSLTAASTSAASTRENSPER